MCVPLEVLIYLVLILCGHLLFASIFMLHVSVGPFLVELYVGVFLFLGQSMSVSLCVCWLCFMFFVCSSFGHRLCRQSPCIFMTLVLMILTS